MGTSSPSERTSYLQFYWNFNCTSRQQEYRGEAQCSVLSSKEMERKRESLGSFFSFFFFFASLFFLWKQEPLTHPGVMRCDFCFCTHILPSPIHCAHSFIPSRPLSNPFPVSVIETSGVLTDGPYQGSVNLTNGYARLFMEFEKAFMYDGIPVFQIDPNPLGDRIKVDLPITATFPVTSSIPSCAPFHFHHLIYDPSIGILFSSPVSDPSSPPVPPSQIRNRKTVTIIGAVIGSLLVAVIIAIILLAIFVPSVKNFFRPYSKSQSSSITQTDTNRSTSNWEKAKTPKM
jgi:hypothetical protein